MSYIDFAEIKRLVSIDKAAAFLELPVTSKDQIRAPCPACKTDDPRALVVTKSEQKYYCFAAKRGGDCIALVAHIRGLGMREAAELLQREVLGTDSTRHRSNTGTSTSRRKQPQENKQAPAAIGLTPLEYLDHAHEAVAELGLSAEDAEALGIGYANKGIMRGLVAVPVRLENGELAGYIGVTEARLPSRWHGLNVVPFKKRA